MENPKQKWNFENPEIFENFEIWKFRSVEKIFLKKFFDNFFHFHKLCEHRFLTSYWTPSNSFWSQRTSYLNLQTFILNPGKSVHLLSNPSLNSFRSSVGFEKNLDVVDIVDLDLGRFFFDWPLICFLTSVNIWSLIINRLHGFSDSPKVVTKMYLIMRTSFRTGL